MAKISKIILLAFCLGQLLYSQESDVENNFDNKYLEDQFYVGIGYNFLVNKPEGIIQRNLSYNLQLGIIKDIPMNKQRNFGIGIGLGYATNSYYTNLLALSTDNEVVYRLSDTGESFNRSKIETHALEFPFELRWRTSNPVDYKFWRIYAGFKLEYLFSARSKITADDLSIFEGDTSFSNETINLWQYGLTMNFGYNTWNLHLYWALSDFLDNSAQFNSTQLQMNPFRIGIIFYIL